jgi:GntR family transcriptional regulator
MYTSQLTERDRRPLPVQIRDSLVQLIDEEGMRPGDRLPTEEDLARHFQVGRTTVREALRQLEEQGLIKVQRGLGRFVTAAAAHVVRRPITRFESITEMMRSLGHTVTSRILSIEEGPASPEEADALGIDDGDPVYRLIRLRLADGDPVLYCVNVLRADMLPATTTQDDWSGSLIERLAEHGHQVVSSTARASAQFLPEAAREHFPEHDGEPWLLISETCVTEHGIPILLAWDYFRGDTFTFEFVRRPD